LELFEISVVGTTTGGKGLVGLDPVGGVIATITGLKPNYTYLVTVENTYHIALYINNKQYSGYHYQTTWNGKHWWRLDGDTNNKIGYANGSKTAPLSWNYHVMTDSNGQLVIEGWLCSTNDHKYITDLRYTVTWEEENVYKQTDWHNPW